jgi:hypothetical protein
VYVETLTLKNKYPCIGIKNVAAVCKYFNTLVINIKEQLMNKMNGLFEGGFPNEWKVFFELKLKLDRRKEGQYEPPKQRVFIGFDNLEMVFALFGGLMGGALIAFVGEILICVSLFLYVVISNIRSYSIKL